MARRYYSSTAVATTLAAPASNSATSIEVTALSGYPVSTPWTAILDPDTASEEVVEVTGVSGTTLTVTRGVDGTTAVSHSAGAVFRHGVSGRDFDEANSHVNDSTNDVHSQYVTKSLITAKGQVVGASGSGVPVAIPAASGNGQVMVSDSAAASGNKFSSEVGTLSFPDGSASAPSITNTGDTDTGIAFPADNTLGITTAGTERLRIGSTGNVGIGTTSPGGALHLVNATAAVLVERPTDTAAAAGAIILRRNRGTTASPTAVQAGDSLGTIGGRGYMATAFASGNSAQVRYTADEGWTDSANGTRLEFFTTPNTTTTLTERLRVGSDGLITGTGSLGAWVSFTPTLGGTGWAIGNGTIQGRYMQLGKFITFKMVVTFGSTSTFGSVSPTLTFPVTPVATLLTATVAQALFADTSLANLYTGAVIISSTAAMEVNSLTTNGQHAVTNATTPFTWADGDVIRVAGTYEAA